jgi:hypothetical protein
VNVRPFVEDDPPVVAALIDSCGVALEKTDV